MKIYSIVVTYNGFQWVDKCFGSLVNSQIEGEHHIVVIDNASADGTIALIKQNFPEVEVVANDKNLGFGAANNIGVRKALREGADYVFLLNQDAWIEENTIFELVELHKKNSKFGVLSPVQMHPSGEVETQFSVYLNNKNNIRHGHIIETDFVNAAVWLIPMSVIKEIGFFDPLFFHYGEDNNYCNRLLYYGYKIGICESLQINHDRVFTTKRSDLKIEAVLKNSLTNINVTLFFALSKYLRKFPKRLIKSMYQKDVKQFLGWFVWTLKMPFLLPQIIKSRKRVKPHLRNA